MHEVFLPFGSDVSFMLFALDNLLVISCQLMQHCHVINWGHKWKTRVSAAGTPSPFLPLCTLEISSFAQKETSAPYAFQANIEVDNTHKDLT